MNLKMVFKFLGFLVWALAIFMLVPAVVSLAYGEVHTALAFAAACGICGVLGLAPVLLFWRESSNVYAREGFVVAGVGWVLVSLLGALPFYISGEIPQYSNAFFESVAGFTTTGTFLQYNMDTWSRGLLFWRNFTQWLGGVGVLAFILAVVRGRVGSGFAQHMFRAESPGPMANRVMPKTKSGVRLIFGVYGRLSALCLIFLLLGGMPVFDAFCTMFGVAGTGGFGVHPDSMASYSAYLQVVCGVFMLLFGVNFVLYMLVLKGDIRRALRDEELHWYLCIVAGGTLIIAASLFFSGHMSIGGSLHNGLFMVSSVITSTGLSIGDYSTWPALARAVLFVLMIVGAMGGSTAGGFKVSRLLIMFKSVRAGLHRMAHPRSVTTLRVNGKALNEEVVHRVQIFLFLYCTIILGAFLLVSIDGLPLEVNLTSVIACTNNLGPGFGLVSTVPHFEAYSTFSRIVLSVCMLVGRLEIFPIVLLFTPGTWKLKS